MLFARRPAVEFIPFTVAALTFFGRYPRIPAVQFFFIQLKRGVLTAADTRFIAAADLVIARSRAAAAVAYPVREHQKSSNHAILS